VKTMNHHPRPWQVPLPLLLATVVAWTGTAVRAADDPLPPNGLLVPTAESKARFAELTQEVVYVRRNILGWQRLLTRMGDPTGMALDIDIASLGEEFVTQGNVPPAYPLMGDTNDPPPQTVAAVDNSVLDAFPPIRNQGSQGSCSAFSSTYYQMTHNTALARGWNAKTGGDTFRFSPKWTYNMINGGSDSGSYIADAMAVAADHGAALWSAYPYTGSTGDATPWCLDSNIWQNAISYRMQAHYTISSIHTPTGLSNLKIALDNGYVAGFDSYSPWGYNGWIQGAVSNDPGTTNDTPYIGQQICTHVVSLDWGHAMTIVGYNDDIWCDLNTNGVVDAGEKGALKIANSWGTGWGNGGYAWMAYDALQNETAVTNGPAPGNRVYAIGYGNYASNSRVYVSTARSSYTPTRIGRFTVRHPKRSQMIMRVGKGAAGSAVPSQTWTGAALSADGGSLAFNGTTGSAVTATFALDFSGVTPDRGYQYFIAMQDTLADDQNGELIDFALIDNPSQTIQYVNRATDPGAFSPSTGVASGITAYASIALPLGLGELTDVTPASGLKAGGYTVTLRGTALGNGTDVTNITLGAISAQSIVSQSATQVVIVAGTAATAGVGNVRVFSSSQGIAEQPDGFTYTDNGKLPQVIAFPPQPTRRTSDTVMLLATASSGLPISFSVASGPALITGGTYLSFNGVGNVSITAVQAGNEEYDPAPQVTRTFLVLGNTPFKVQAIALTNNVVLRWTDPMASGISNRTVHVRSSTAGYPLTAASGAFMYTGTNSLYTHTNLTPYQTYYYSIFVSQNGSTFIVPNTTPPAGDPIITSIDEIGQTGGNEP